MPTILITGASRGLGLEFVRQYAGDGWQVIACARDLARTPELGALAAESAGRVSVHALDIADHAAIDALANRTAGAPIDVLLNNAGTMGRHSFAEKGMTIQRFGESDYADWVEIMRINVFAPMKMAEAFVEHVAASAQKKIVTLTSIVGSIGQNTFGSLYAYRSSKAAANCVMHAMAMDLKKRGIVAVPMHPGWVRTDIGGSRAELDVVQSVSGMRRVIAGLTAESSGRFFQWDGREVPW